MFSLWQFKILHTKRYSDLEDIRGCPRMMRNGYELGRCLLRVSERMPSPITVLTELSPSSLDRPKIEMKFSKLIYLVLRITSEIVLTCCGSRHRRTRTNTRSLTAIGENSVHFQVDLREGPSSTLSLSGTCLVWKGGNKLRGVV